MEPGFYLTALVFAVAILHLITRGVVSFRHHFKALSPTSSKAQNKRSDWYMFFHCSALTGETQEQVVRKGKDKNISVRRGKSKAKDSRVLLRSYLA
ncbi:hypothetical protein [Desulforhopalus sp. 52FAK]